MRRMASCRSSSRATFVPRMSSLMPCAGEPGALATGGSAGAGAPAPALPPVANAPGSPAQGIKLDIRGTKVALDDDLQEAIRLMPALAKAWKTFTPAGQMSFAAHIDR